MIQLRGIRDGYRKEEIREDERRMSRLSAQREELRAKALAKLQAGEKLNFDDLQFIYGPGSGASDDDDEKSILDDKLPPRK
jgi:uncharacterized coiled-coil DUF342 family protein